MHILKDFISLGDLLVRWRCEKELIESFTWERDSEPRLMMWYDTEIRTRPDGGQSAFVKPARYLNGCIFDMADVLEIEGLHPELVRTGTDQGDSEPKMIGDKFIFTEQQLIKKEDLYKRWFGATHEEIARHFEAGELRVYEHYKGPINGVIWCNPGGIYYQAQQDFFNSGQYDYYDHQCDYFLLKDVAKYETEHPEYAGNVTPESLGLIQDEASGAPEEETEYIKAENLRKEMGLSPVQFVDYLRDNQDLALFGNGVDDSSRRWFYQTASREQAVDMLEDMYIHRLDIEIHKKRVGEPTSVSPFPVGDSIASPMADIPFPTAAVDTPGLESQIAELQAALEEKDARIAELKGQLAAAKERSDALVCDGKGLPTVVCRMRREGKGEKEIAQYLSDKGQWCSNPQVGALLHENTEVSGVTHEAMTKHAQRLLDKA